MGTHTDVAFAVTLKLDKLIRETLQMLAAGHEAVRLMDSMFQGLRKGWKLYHDADIHWYIDEDGPARDLHQLLLSMTEEEETSTQLSYFRMHKEYVPEGLIDHDGEYEDPFHLGYSLRLEYDRKPRPPPPHKKKIPCPPKRRKKARTRTRAKPRVER